MKVNTLATAVLAAVLLGSLASCGVVPSDPSGESFLTREEIEQEYDGTVKSYPYNLPDGVTFPADLYVVPNEDPNAQYESGWGAMQAYFFAECAYERVALTNPVDDSAGTIAALDQIQLIHTLPIYQQHFDDSHGVWQGLMDKARLGDSTGLRGTYDSDCASDWFQGK